MILDIVLIGGIALLVLVVMTIFFAKIYRKASKEISFVRTGLGGEKVISNGGALVFRLFHDTIQVNMMTLRLLITRKEKQALITKDKIRVDVEAEFYLRVKQTKEAISIAAQTLGERTKDPEALKQLIEGKLVDALRSVSAEMEMNELHEMRADFVQRVQNTLASDLEKNGLELESVSLTGLDQTNVEHFDPNNAFDSQGLTKITKTIEENRKMQNDLRQISAVEIARRNQEAELEQLTIQKTEQLARLQQQQEIENHTATQRSQIARIQSEQKRATEEARISSEREVEEANIKRNQALQEAEIQKEIAVSERAKEKAVAEGQVRETQILADRKVREAEIQKEKALKDAQIASDIALAEKSMEHSKAEAQKNAEFAKAVIAEEKVTTARDTEAAERRKQISLLAAREKAEQEAIERTLAAKAKAEAAQLEAQAIRNLADAEAEKYRIEAEGTLKINEAANAISAEQVALRVKLALIEALPNIIAESVKPIEHIQSLKILDVRGLERFGGSPGSASQGNNTSGNSGSGNLGQDLMNAALSYRAHVPILDKLLAEIGIKGNAVEDMIAAVEESTDGGQTPLAEPDGV
ncbi:MAG: flotillin family protein [Spirochaetes bacterium]|nr:flotillin family protein [Spirochaetota bacterium]MBU0955465.1 flotillin family protein [Spirochaetota bacterium]